MMSVSHRFAWYKTQKELIMPTVDPNAVILTGENPFIRLSATDGGPNTTEASFWRITFSPGGPGHVLYLTSELTDNQLRIYADNIAAVSANLLHGFGQFNLRKPRRRER